MNTDMPMPADVAAEKFVLVCMMLEKTGQAYSQAAANLTAGDFSLDSHRRIFNALQELAEQGEQLDYLTVSSRLRAKKELEAVGGDSYIFSMADGHPLVKNISSYVRIVKDKSNLRQVIHIASGAISAAYEQMSPAGHILSTMQNQVLEIQANGTKGQAAKISEFSEETWKVLCQRRAMQSRLVGFSTGIPRLDEKTTGIREGEFWIIGGRAGDGKTSLGLQFAAANASAGTPVGFFSIEMDRNSLLERLWSAAGGVDYKRVRDPKFLDASDAQALAAAKEKVDHWPLFIEEEGNYTIGELEARARLMISQHHVKLIIVDYLQIVDAAGRDERQKLTKISKVLRMLAKSAGVAIVGLSQMPRPRDHDLNKRPTKFDLKESGSLENDAHTVLLIYRPVDEHNQFTFYDEVIIGKQRSGETANIEVVYFGKYMRFEERAL